MSVKHKKVPYIYKEYENVIRLWKQESNTVEISIRQPKHGDFLANNIYIFKIFCFFVMYSDGI